MSAPWEIVGTVEILRMRVYPIDPKGRGDDDTTVCVQPGSYPVYRKLDQFCFVMDGKVNERIESLGDGLYALHSGDSPTGVPVSFPSRLMDRDTLDELIADASRFRFHIPGVTS